MEKTEAMNTRRKIQNKQNRWLFDEMFAIKSASYYTYLLEKDYEEKEHCTLRKTKIHRF